MGKKETTRKVSNNSQGNSIGRDQYIINHAPPIERIDWYDLYQSEKAEKSEAVRENILLRDRLDILETQIEFKDKTIAHLKEQIADLEKHSQWLFIKKTG